MNCNICKIDYDKLYAKNNCRSCYMKKWSENNSKRKRYRDIWNWINRGLIELNGVYTYESLHEYYLSVDNCEVCNKKFINDRDKCLDHCHYTNLFRAVLCRRCNNNDKWMSK